jgi:hypothetical protein
MPPDEALVAEVALHGSMAAVDRAHGWPAGTLDQYMRRPSRTALRATCKAYSRKPHEMRNYPTPKPPARPRKPPRVLLTAEQRVANNRRSGRDYMRRRRLEDPPTVRARRRLSMAGRKPAGKKPALDPDLNDYARVLRADPCSYCGAVCEHLDHIVAVAADGTLTWDNLTAACGPCNRRKRTIPLLLFLLQGGAQHAH